MSLHNLKTQVNLDKDVTERMSDSLKQTEIQLISADNLVEEIFDALGILKGSKVSYASIISAASNTNVHLKNNSFALSLEDDFMK